MSEDIQLALSCRYPEDGTRPWNMWAIDPAGLARLDGRECLTAADVAVSMAMGYQGVVETVASWPAVQDRPACLELARSGRVDVQTVRTWRQAHAFWSWPIWWRRTARWYDVYDLTRMNTRQLLGYLAACRRVRAGGYDPTRADDRLIPEGAIRAELARRPHVENRDERRSRIRDLQGRRLRTNRRPDEHP